MHETNTQSDLEACERLSKWFYRCFDRHDIAGILQITAQDCVWVRMQKPVSGSDAIEATLRARDQTVLARHLVANACARQTADGGVEVLFDVIYLAEAAEKPRVLSGLDRYLRTESGWKLVFKQADLVF